MKDLIWDTPFASVILTLSEAMRKDLCISSIPLCCLLRRFIRQCKTDWPKSFMRCPAVRIESNRYFHTKRCYKIAMPAIGFSTGALALGDVQHALALLRSTTANAVELSALRQNELPALVNLVNELDLSQFEYISVHAPSALEPEYEETALELLAVFQERNWPIIVHPDAMHDIAEWRRFGELLYIENMDIRKPIGQTASHLAAIFAELPQACLCFDIGYARQVDPTMSEAAQILLQLKDRLGQLHISEVNAQSKHDRLSLEAVMAFRRVASLIPADVPVILESRVDETEVQQEIDNAIRALDTRVALAIAGD